MRITLKFWDYVKFEAVRTRVKPATACSRLLRSGLRPRGAFHRKVVRVDLSRAAVAEILTERILARVKYCDCGAVAVLQDSTNANLCLRCFDLDRCRSFQDPEFPQVAPAGI